MNLHRAGCALGLSLAFACSSAGPIGSPGVDARVDASTAGEEKDEKDGAITTNVGAQCKKYLSCIASTQPETYAARLALYGEKAPCWDSAEQAANCERACAEELARIASECPATPAFKVSEGTYRVTSNPARNRASCRISYFGATAAVEHQAASGRKFRITIEGGSGSYGPFAVQGDAVVTDNQGTIDWMSTDTGVDSNPRPLTVTANDTMTMTYFSLGDSNPSCAKEFTLTLTKE